MARAEAAWALEQHEALLATEAKAHRRLEAGELGLDLYGLNDKLAVMGWVQTLQR